MRDEIHPTRMKIAFILSVVLIGIPFIGSGYVLAVILTAALSLYLFKSKKVDIKTLNTILVCLMVVVVGYSSYALTLIRATARHADEPERTERYLYVAYLSGT